MRCSHETIATLNVPGTLTNSTESNVYVDLYNASTQMPLTRSDIDHTMLPANYTISAFTAISSFNRPNKAL